jgi:type III restriction enzyme
MESFWIPGENRLGVYGRWVFAEFTGVFDIHDFVFTMYLH